MYNKTIRPKKRYSPLQFIDTSQPASQQQQRWTGKLFCPTHLLYPYAIVWSPTDRHSTERLPSPQNVQIHSLLKDSSKGDFIDFFDPHFHSPHLPRPLHIL